MGILYYIWACWRVNSFCKFKLKSLLFDSEGIVRRDVLWDHFVGDVSQNFEMIYWLIYVWKAKSLGIFLFYSDRGKFMIFYKRVNRWKYLCPVYWIQPVGESNTFFLPWTFEIYIRKCSKTFCGFKKIYFSFEKHFS